VSTASVQSIHVYPTHGEPGQDLTAVEVSEAGLSGDRPKKAPVMVLSAEDTSGARANFVVDLGVDELAAAIDQVIEVGEVELAVTGTAGNCPGVYAAVGRGGTVRVGDVVTVREPG
jgi:uncharacterized protein YcbX